jgi:hypothetical protein
MDQTQSTMRNKNQFQLPNVVDSTYYIHIKIVANSPYKTIPKFREKHKYIILSLQMHNKP